MTHVVPLTPTNTFFVARSVSVTLRSGLVLLLRSHSPSIYRLSRPYDLLHRDETPSSVPCHSPPSTGPPDVADHHLTFVAPTPPSARPLCTGAKSRWDGPALGLTPVSQSTARGSHILAFASQRVKESRQYSPSVGEPLFCDECTGDSYYSFVFALCSPAEMVAHYFRAMSVWG